MRSVADAHVPQDQRKDALADAAEADHDQAARKFHVYRVVAHRWEPDPEDERSSVTANCGRGRRSAARDQPRGAPSRQCGGYVRSIARQRFDTLDPARECGIRRLHRQEARAQFASLALLQRTPQQHDPGEHDEVGGRGRVAYEPLDVLSRPSIVRASPATRCIARVISSARSSMLPRNAAWMIWLSDALRTPGTRRSPA